MLPVGSSPIDSVVAQLEDVVAWCLSKRPSPSRIGYFASLYLRVTNTIRSKLGTGYFDDDARMERLDAIFAGRFLSAFGAFATGEGVIPLGWSTVFDASSRNDLVIVEHLLLGINVHINVDLGIAAATACPGAELPPLRDDFMKITSLLAGIAPTVVSEIGALSPLIGMMNFLGDDGELAVQNFSIAVARNEAWSWANQLAELSPTQLSSQLAERNDFAAGLNSRIVRPGLILEGAVDLVRSRESGDVAAIINTLNNGNPTITL